MTVPGHLFRRRSSTVVSRRQWRTVRRYRGCLSATPSNRSTPSGYVQSTPERAGLWEIQTPQIFQRKLIVAAHDRAAREGIEATDDAMVVERMDKPVFVVAGERTNFKITVPEDLSLAEALIRAGVVS